MVQFINDSPREACAVIGVSARNGEAAGLVYNGLLALQHRGQEGAGITVCSDNRLITYKNVGLVSEVFNPQVMSSFPESFSGLGHCRYSTSGANTLENVQPFVTEYLTGRIATAHNGNIVNALSIKRTLMQYGVTFSASSDSEIISSLIAYETVKRGDIEAGIAGAMEYLEGAFSLVILSGDGKIIAARDPWGFRPLCIGRSEIGMAAASESCALDSQGFSFERDVRPGEIVVIENGEITSSRTAKTASERGICIFEYVYFARADSTIDGLNVYEARYNMGRILAAECGADADLVCGVPDSGLEAAAGYAAESGLPLTQGFVKNRYIGRSFIFPTQAQRENAVKLKLNPLRANVEGKRIVLIDDSIVRGTTCAKIIAALKNAGALEVHLRISSPPFKHTCYFGTDIGLEENLAANRMTIEQIGESVGADSLQYISVDGLRRACQKCALPFCSGCFTGKYNIEPEEHISKLQLEKESV